MPADDTTDTTAPTQLRADTQFTADTYTTTGVADDAVAGTPATGLPADPAAGEAGPVPVMTVPGGALIPATFAVPGAFVVYADGIDVDDALDAARTLTRLAAPSGPSILDVDPADLHMVAGTAEHPWLVLEAQLAALGELPAGALWAAPVAPHVSFRHRRVRVVTTDVTLPLPDVDGLLVPLPALVRAVVSAALPTPDPLIEPWQQPRLVGVELTAAPRRRFRVVAERVKGPRTVVHALFCSGVVVATYPTASEATRAARQLAADVSGPARVEIRPWVSRNDGEPFVNVERRLVTQRAVLRAVLAEQRRDAALRTTGWIFAGRSPGSGAPYDARDGGR